MSKEKLNGINSVLPKYRIIPTRTIDCRIEVVEDFQLEDSVFIILGIGIIQDLNFKIIVLFSSTILVLSAKLEFNRWPLFRKCYYKFGAFI